MSGEKNNLVEIEAVVWQMDAGEPTKIKALGKIWREDTGEEVKEKKKMSHIEQVIIKKDKKDNQIDFKRGKTIATVNNISIKQRVCERLKEAFIDNGWFHKDILKKFFENEYANLCELSLKKYRSAYMSHLRNVGYETQDMGENGKMRIFKPEVVPDMPISNGRFPVTDSNSIDEKSL